MGPGRIKERNNFFSDEATYCNTVELHRYNFHYWSEENTQWHRVRLSAALECRRLAPFKISLVPFKS